MKWVGPILIKGNAINAELSVPLATYESPLWPSVARGARVSRLCGGIDVTITGESMTRSILLEAPSAAVAAVRSAAFRERRDEVAAAVSGTSRFARLQDVHIQQVGRLLYIRLEISTGDAAGHNMVTKAAEAVMQWALEAFSDLQYQSISGNFCTDKKTSAVNGILGRGKYAIAELLVPSGICQKQLRCSPERLTDLNTKKNLLGSIIAGSLRSANAHYANMLLAFYLATGQDAANIVEGSQGISTAEVTGGDLLFSCTLPNLIVGTAGNGKDLAFVRQNLEQLGCTGDARPGEHARRLAAIAAAAVLCGELSLMAAQCNPGELMRAHLKLERRT